MSTRWKKSIVRRGTMQKDFPETDAKNQENSSGSGSQSSEISNPTTNGNESSSSSSSTATATTSSDIVTQVGLSNADVSQEPQNIVVGTTVTPANEITTSEPVNITQKPEESLTRTEAEAAEERLTAASSVMSDNQTLPFNTTTSSSSSSSTNTIISSANNSSENIKSDIEGPKRPRVKLSENLKTLNTKGQANVDSLSSLSIAYHQSIQGTIASDISSIEASDADNKIICAADDSVALVDSIVNGDKFRKLSPPITQKCNSVSVQSVSNFPQHSVTPTVNDTEGFVDAEEFEEVCVNKLHQFVFEWDAPLLSIVGTQQQQDMNNSLLMMEDFVHPDNVIKSENKKYYGNECSTFIMGLFDGDSEFPTVIEEIEAIELQMGTFTRKEFSFCQKEEHAVPPQAINFYSSFIPSSFPYLLELKEFTFTNQELTNNNNTNIGMRMGLNNGMLPADSSTGNFVGDDSSTNNNNNNNNNSGSSNSSSTTTSTTSTINGRLNRAESIHSGKKPSSSTATTVSTQFNRGSAQAGVTNRQTLLQTTSLSSVNNNNNNNGQITTGSSSPSMSSSAPKMLARKMSVQRATSNTTTTTTITPTNTSSSSFSSSSTTTTTNNNNINNAGVKGNNNTDNFYDLDFVFVYINPLYEDEAEKESKRKAEEQIVSSLLKNIDDKHIDFQFPPDDNDGIIVDLSSIDLTYFWPTVNEEYVLLQDRMKKAQEDFALGRGKNERSLSVMKKQVCFIPLTPTSTYPVLTGNNNTKSIGSSSLSTSSITTGGGGGSTKFGNRDDGYESDNTLQHIEIVESKQVEALGVMERLLLDVKNLRQLAMDELENHEDYSDDFLEDRETLQDYDSFDLQKEPYSFIKLNPVFCEPELMDEYEII